MRLMHNLVNQTRLIACLMFKFFVQNTKIQKIFNKRGSQPNNGLLDFCVIDKTIHQCHSK